MREGLDLLHQKRVRAEPGPLRRAAPGRRRQLPAALLPRRRRWPGWAAAARPSRASSAPIELHAQLHPGARRHSPTSRMARRDRRGALEAVRRGQQDAPNEPVLFDREGQIWQRLGEADAALAAYRQVATLAPKDALVRWRIGELLLTQRRPEPALRSSTEATTLDPGVADYWNSLGMVLGGGGQNDEAARAFRQAISLGPKNAQYAYNLGLVLMRAGQPEAAEWFRRALSLDPTFAPARQRLAELGAMSRRPRRGAADAAAVRGEPRPVPTSTTRGRAAASPWAPRGGAGARGGHGGAVLAGRRSPVPQLGRSRRSGRQPAPAPAASRRCWRGRSRRARWATTSRCRGWRWRRCPAPRRRRRGSTPPRSSCTRSPPGCCCG